MTAVADAIGISRQHLASGTIDQRRSGADGRRCPTTSWWPEAKLNGGEAGGHIRLAIADLPTYDYRRVHALLRRQAEKIGRAAPRSRPRKWCNFGCGTGPHGIGWLWGDL